MEKWAAEAENSGVIFTKLDIDANGDVADAEGISAVPTFRFYKKSKVTPLLSFCLISGLDDRCFPHA